LYSATQKLYNYIYNLHYFLDKNRSVLFIVLFELLIIIVLFELLIILL